MTAHLTLMIAAVAGFTGVGLGAFGAHGLKTVLSPDMMTVWQTAVQYHLVHTQSCSHKSAGQGGELLV